MILANNARISEARQIYIYETKEKQNEKELVWTNIWGQ